MSENNTNVPKIRFPGFTDGWERHSLSNVGDFERISVDPQATPDKSFVEYSMPSYDNGRNPETIFGHSMQSMRIKISGDVLLINKLNVRQRRIWFVKDTPINAVASSEFMPFTSTKIDLAFLEQLMLSDKTTRDLESISSGTSNSQKRITPSDVLKYRIKLPVDRLEQEKIGSFFKNIDNLINLHQRKLKHLHDKKKSLLQKMFPKDGSDVPEIRFPGFTDAWEQRKLGDVVEFFSGLTYSPDNVIEDGGTFVLRSSNVKNGEIVDADNVYVGSDIVNSDNVQIGDVIVVVRNGSRDLIGKHAQIKKQMNNTVIGAFMTGVRSETPNFTNAMLDTQKFRIEINKNLGATINQITTGAFKKMEFHIPVETVEREQVGTFFAQLDNLITLHQRKLKHVQELKKSLLQQMFV